MSVATAIFRNGEVLLDDEVDWADGIALEVRTKVEPDSGSPAQSASKTLAEVLLSCPFKEEGGLLELSRSPDLPRNVDLG